MSLLRSHLIETRRVVQGEMKSFSVVLLVVVVGCCMETQGKILTRCELVHQLRQNGFPEDKLRDWVCLVENESGRRTVRKSTKNKNGSYDYGLFQINDKYWCSSSGPAGKDCNVTCADVNKDDITQACQCAKKIFKRHGFTAWYGWKNHCKGTLPDISKC